MKKLTKKTVLRSLAAQTAMVLTLVTVMYFAAGLAGCRATADSVHLLDGDFVAPELRYFAPQSSSSVSLRFSKPVILSSVEVREMETNILCGEATREPDEDPLAVILQLASPTTLGVRYWMNGIVTDKSGNSLDFSVGFTGYNDRVPTLLLSEVRSKNGIKTVNKVSLPQVEFVELYALSDGNLAGVQLFNAADGIEKTFDFPASEVKKGAYIVVHFGKSTELVGTKDELDTALDLSVNSNATVSRDFWVTEDVRRLSETDIFLLRERAGGKLLDVLLTNNSSTKTAWADKFLPAANEAAASGLWPNAGDLASAMDSTKVTTHNRTFSRKNSAAPQSGPDAWHLTATPTPGVLNTAAPYVASLSKAVAKK